jgi:hypothetical protein
MAASFYLFLWVSLVESFWEILVDFQQQKISPALLLVASFYMFFWGLFSGELVEVSC